jgi:tRNA(Ile)-lysidine synthase
VEQWLKINIVEQNGIQSITIEALIAMQGTASIIYFWLRSYGFNSDQAQAIHHSLEQGATGKLFESATYIVNVDRDIIYLAPISEKFKSIELSDQAIKFTIAEGDYELLELISPVNLDQKKANAMLDLERLKFPLTIRTWEQGDRFIPLGMKSQKKISDFLIDLKIPLLRKQEIKVLISDQEIAWVIGHRIADWAKITAATRKVLYLKKTDLC